MNRRRKEIRKRTKNSPVLFEDEEIGTSSSDEVKISKSSTSAGHSTPVQSKADISDIPDLNYSESPIEQLTQHPPNEVGWDYHRPFSKEENGISTFSAGINHTPKRNVLLSKKRNSNSPLLYKPLKKKLIHEEQKEDVAGFMEELQAIATNIKMNGEKNSENSKKTDCEVESELVIEIDSELSDESDIKLQISNNTDESPGQNNAVLNNNYAALLNDSMENVMVLCSQEVENEFNKKKPPFCTNTSQDKASLKVSPDSSLEKMFKNLSKENVQPVREIEKSTESTGKYSPVSKAESCSSEIPDDSFDQFFTEIDDTEFCKDTEISIVANNSTKAKSYTKVPVTSTTSKNSTMSNKFFHTKVTVSTSVRPQSTVFNNHESQSVTVSVQNKAINSNANFGYLNKGYIKNDSSGFGSQASSIHSDKNTETRFLKTKSFSGPNLSQSSTTNKSFMCHNSRSTSNLNVNTMKEEQNVNLISMSENKSWRRTNSGSFIGQPSLNSNINTQTSNLNKFSNSGSQTLFTPEEIERKRLEALNRREAKKKFNNLAVTRTVHNQIKR